MKFSYNISDRLSVNDVQANVDEFSTIEGRIRLGYVSAVITSDGYIKSRYVGSSVRTRLLTLDGEQVCAKHFNLCRTDSYKLNLAKDRRIFLLTFSEPISDDQFAGFTFDIVLDDKANLTDKYIQDTLRDWVPPEVAVSVTCVANEKAILPKVLHVCYHPVHTGFLIPEAPIVPDNRSAYNEATIQREFSELKKDETISYELLPSHQKQSQSSYTTVVPAISLLGSMWKYISPTCIHPHDSVFILPAIFMAAKNRDPLSITTLAVVGCDKLIETISPEKLSGPLGSIMFIAKAILLGACVYSHLANESQQDTARS